MSRKTIGAMSANSSRACPANAHRRRGFTSSPPHAREGGAQRPARVVLPTQWGGGGEAAGGASRAVLPTQSGRGGQRPARVVLPTQWGGGGEAAGGASPRSRGPARPRD